MNEAEVLRQSIKAKQQELIRMLRQYILELLPTIDSIEDLQKIYAYTLAAFYDEGKPAEYYLNELQTNHLHIIR